MKPNKKYFSILDQQTLTGRSFVTVLTTLATLAAVISTAYPILKKDIEADLQFKLVKYGKTLDDYNNTIDLLDQMQSSIYAAVFLVPMIKNIESQLESNVAHNSDIKHKYFIGSMENIKKQFNKVILDTALKPVSHRNEGRYLGDMANVVIREIHNEYSSVMLLCGFEEEDNVLVTDYFREKYKNHTDKNELIQEFFGLSVEKLPADLQNITISTFENLEIGKTCMNQMSLFFEHHTKLRIYLDNYVQNYNEIPRT